MQANTWGVLAWVGLILCYAWSVRNLARLGRRPPASDAGASSLRIVVGGGRRSAHARTLAAGDPMGASRRWASGSPT